jgi:hypothetical protein
METLLKADIFFFISTLATVVITVMAAVLLFYLIRARKSLNNLLNMLKDNLGAGEEFVSDLRERMEENVIFRTFFPPAKKSKRKTKKSE